MPSRISIRGCFMSVGRLIHRSVFFHEKISVNKVGNINHFITHPTASRRPSILPTTTPHHHLLLVHHYPSTTRTYRCFKWHLFLLHLFRFSSLWVWRCSFFSIRVRRTRIVPSVDSLDTFLRHLRLDWAQLSPLMRTLFHLAISNAHHCHWRLRRLTPLLRS